VSFHAQLLRTTKPLRYELDDWLYRRSGEGRQLEQLRDVYKGRPLLVVGNGPSLNRTPLDAFAAIPSIGMNKIDLIFPRVAWRPSMVLCTNNVVVRQHADVFRKSAIPVYLAWKSRWFARRRGAEQIRYFNSTLDETFSTDITRRVGSSATVTYAALQFAYFTGADPVIVVGVDHSFDKTGDHAYERRQGPDNNHFDPNYFASGTVWGLPNLDESEVAYARSRVAFEKAGRRVLDATVGGKLQIFEKIAIDEAVALASPSIAAFGAQKT
jgi:hypothetical protein